MAKVAIVTNFRSFDPWYSLTGIVKDQIRMSQKYGNEVFLFVSESFEDDLFPIQHQFPGLVIERIMPGNNLKDYQTGEPLTPEHNDLVDQITGVLTEKLREHDIHVAFTHDLIFTGWNRPYATGIQNISLSDIRWFHWVHSVPSGFRDWWNMALYGQNHKIVYPNNADRITVAANFRTTVENVKIIPHIKDLRVMFNFVPTTCDLITACPGLMQADIVQIYPASTDRFESKRVKEVIRIFGKLKKLGHSVLLFIANQFPISMKKDNSIIHEYLRFGMECGLEPRQDFIFSSMFDDHFTNGVPQRVLFELMQLSNLFIFPTREESFGLVLPEVSLASGALCVLNASLPMQMEVSGSNALYIDFGSFKTNINLTSEQWDEYADQIALIIACRMQDNDSIATRTFMRKRYNMDNIYRKYYAPIISEALSNRLDDSDAMSVSNLH